jgi:hypothetical protein
MRECANPGSTPPYFQFNTGEEFFQHALPHERSGLSRRRRRLGDKLELLLAESLRVAHEADALCIAKISCSQALKHTIPPCNQKIRGQPARTVVRPPIAVISVATALVRVSAAVAAVVWHFREEKFLLNKQILH